MTGQTRYLETLHAGQVEAAALREYINTEGSLWIDRVSVSHAELQRARLGGIAIVRNAIYPGHSVSWRFATPGDEARVAILVSEATPERVRMTAYNISDGPVAAHMTAWTVEPGAWTLAIGSDHLAAPPARTIQLERTTEVPITFAARSQTTIALDLASRGVPYWSRPDLGISMPDVAVNDREMRITVHSIGAVAAPASRVVLRDRAGQEIVSAEVPALEAPSDLKPRTATTVLALPLRADWRGGSVTIEHDGTLPEITRRNNQVRF
jgi:hypothetical protein